MAVVSLHLGQAGVQLADVCWQQFCTEHDVDLDGSVLGADKKTSPSLITLNSFSSEMSCSHETGDGLEEKGPENLYPFFQEMPDGRYAPRAVFADLEPSVIDAVKCGRLKKLYSPNLLIGGKEDAANNYARGYYSISKTIKGDVMEQTRKVIEACDRHQGFMMYHSIGGGTGSGFEALLLNFINEEYPKPSVLGVSIYPSPRLSTAVVEPYNAVLNTSSTLGGTDCVFQCDNEAIYNICNSRLDIDNPNYLNLNQLLATTVSSITSSLRFKGSLNADFVDFQTNLVPYPRIHFAVMSYAPIVSKRKVSHESLSVIDLTLQVFNPQNRLSTCDNEGGRYMACCLIYRGQITPKDVNAAIAQMKGKKTVQFVPWSPTGIKVGMNQKTADSLPSGDMAALRKTVCMVCNTTAVQKTWEALNCKYGSMLSKKAFVHWYTGEGMEEHEFLEAQTNLLTLENDYNELI